MALMAACRGVRSLAIRFRRDGGSMAIRPPSCSDDGDDEAFDVMEAVSNGNASDGG